jgi:hypothetical protein
MEGMKPEGMSSLEVNVVVAEILDAARQSAKTGKTVAFGRQQKAKSSDRGATGLPSRLRASP